jgi:RNase P subunit RPR2
MPSFPPSVAQRRRSITLLACVVDVECARDIEAAVYYAAYTQQCDYGNKLLQLSWNLKAQGPAFVARVGGVHALPLMSDAVLAQGMEVERWWVAHDARIETQRQMLLEEAKFEEGEQLNVGSLICNRCHSRSISVQQQQIRSADEGMTVFCTCNKCHMRWKM